MLFLRRTWHTTIGLDNEREMFLHPKVIFQPLTVLSFARLIYGKAFTLSRLVLRFATLNQALAAMILCRSVWLGY